MIDKLRSELLGRWAGLMCDHPWSVLLSAVALAAVSIVYTLGALTFQSDRNELIDGDLAWNRNYIEYRQRFAGHEQIAVVVESPGDRPAEEAAALSRAFVGALAARLENEPAVGSVVYRIPTAPALARVMPLERYEAALARMAEAEPLLRSSTPGELLAALSGSLRESGGDGGARGAVERIDQMRELIARSRAILGGETADLASALGVEATGEGWTYLTSDDGALYFMDIEVTPVPGEYDPAAPAVAAIRAALQATRDEFKEFNETNTGLTGIPVMEADETIVSMNDSTISSIVALAAIGVLLVVAFHGWQLPAMSLASLMFGVAWTFGFLTMAVGHLQVLSIVFTVILLGLGIDFGIHLLCKFELVRGEKPDTEAGFRAAMVETMRSTGPGIITGAVTTASAFSMTLLTDFRGMAEMGLIAGVGILLCVLAMFSVLPAMMAILWHRRHAVPHVSRRLVDMHAMTYMTPILHRPGLVLLIAAGVTAAAGVGAMRVRYNNDLTALLPEGLESTRWQQVILDHTDRAIWFAVSTTSDLETAGRQTEALRALPAVASVGGVGLLFPEDEGAKLAAGAAVRSRLGEALTEPARGEVETPESLGGRLNALSLALGLALGREDVRSEPAIAASLTALREEAQATAMLLGSAGFREHAGARMRALQGQYDALREGVRERIDRATAQRPLGVDDLPAYLRRDAVSMNSPRYYLLKAYPRHNVWDPDDLKPFIEQIRSVDPQATGSPVQIYESGLLMQRAYQLAGALAFAAVFLLVFIDFGRLFDAALCMVPVALGFVFMLAVSWLAGVTINPANLTVLPLMFGIGVDAGVHILHRYRQDRRAAPPGLSHGTGKGIILTSLTTMFGFAAMMLAHHRGIQSLGFVLTVGIGGTLLASLTVMPALLALRNRYHVWRRYRQWRRIGLELERQRAGAGAGAGAVTSSDARG